MEPGNSLTHKNSDPGKQTMSKLVARIQLFAQSERGAGLVEYALVALLIAIVALIAVQSAGEEVSSQFSTIASGMTDAGSN